MCEPSCLLRASQPTLRELRTTRCQLPARKPSAASFAGCMIDLGMQPAPPMSTSDRRGARGKGEDLLIAPSALIALVRRYRARPLRVERDNDAPWVNSCGGPQCSSERCQLLRYLATQDDIRHDRLRRPTGGAGLGRRRRHDGVAHWLRRQRARLRRARIPVH